MRLRISSPIHHEPSAMFMVSLLKLTHALVDAGISFDIDIPVGESLVTRARNKLARRFLASDCDAQLCLDADLQFEPEDALLLIRSGHPLVGGLYPKKAIDWEQVCEAAIAGVPPEQLHKYAASYVLNMPGGDVTAVDSCIPVDEIGTGFLLIHRSVYEAVTPLCPTYLSDAADDRGTKTVAFFEAPVVDGRLLSEDYEFCRRSRLSGIQPQAHIDVKLGHIGMHCFRGDLMVQLTEKAEAAE